MGTDITPEGQTPAPPEGQPAEQQAPPPEQQGGQPRDDSGRFTTPEPPTVQQPQIPQPPGAPTVNPDEAVQFYERLSHPATRAEEFVKVGRQYGFVPEGLTPDQVQEALLLYDDYQRQMGGQPQHGGQPPLPQAPGADGSWQQDGQQQPPAPFDPEQLLDAWDKRQEQREQQKQLEQQQQERLGNLQSAVGSIAGLDEAKQRILAQNVALGIDTAIANGQQVDFSKEALEGYARQLAGMFGWVAAEEQTETQEAIAQHRATAPQTTVPTGAPQAGAPASGPRGIAGVTARIKAEQAARAAGG